MSSISLHGILQALESFMIAHPTLGVVIVFFLALGESIPVLGVVAPGTSVIVAVAGLAGLGYLPVWQVFLSGLVGAIVGDGLSYWYGHTYRASALRMWPLSRYPALLAQSETFFARHGIKSILFARFMPVVRAFIPLIAGISGMDARRFYVANIASAVAWAVAHILPAALMGASLGALHQISPRMAAVLATILIVAILVLLVFRWILRGSFALGARAVSFVHKRIETRGDWISVYVAKLIGPNSDPAKQFVFLAVVLAGVLLALLNLIEDVLAGGELRRADHAISNLLGTWRSGWGDSLMVYVTSLGDLWVTVAVAGTAIAWIFYKRQYRLGLAVLAAVATTAAFVTGLKVTFEIPRPNAVYGGLSAFSFPSGHASYSAAIYGVLGWIWWQGIPSPWRNLVLWLLAGFVVSIAFSRVYLQVHWPSDVLAGLLFGMTITSVFALVFRQKDFTSVYPLKMLALCGLSLVSIGGWHIATTHAASLEKYAMRTEMIALDRTSWTNADWQQLPAYRVELGGELEYPIVFQWAASLSELERRVGRSNWRLADGLSLGTVSRYLSGDTTPAQLPVSPRFHNGHAPVAAFVHIVPNNPLRDVLYIWGSQYELKSGSATPILIGTIVREEITHPLGWLSLSEVTERDAAKLVTGLKSELPDTKLVTSADPSARTVLIGPLQ